MVAVLAASMVVVMVEMKEYLMVGTRVLIEVVLMAVRMVDE